VILGTLRCCLTIRRYARHFTRQFATYLKSIAVARASKSPSIRALVLRIHHNESSAYYSHVFINKFPAKNYIVVSCALKSPAV